jgi:hypothetical protein
MGTTSGRQSGCCAWGSSGSQLNCICWSLSGVSADGTKTRLDEVSKIGQTDIRKLLIVDAMSRIRCFIRKGILPDNGLGQLVGRKPRMGRGCRASEQD